MVEGLAQTGGLLVCEHSRFTEKVILAKIPKVEFFGDAGPGDTLLYTAAIEYIREEGAAVTATSHNHGVLQAQAAIVFVHLNAPDVAQLLPARDILADDAHVGGVSGRPCRGRQPLDAAAQPAGRRFAATVAARRRGRKQP